MNVKESSLFPTHEGRCSGSWGLRRKEGWAGKGKHRKEKHKTRFWSEPEHRVQWKPTNANGKGSEVTGCVGGRCCPAQRDIPRWRNSSGLRHLLLQVQSIRSGERSLNWCIGGGGWGGSKEAAPTSRPKHHFSASQLQADSHVGSPPISWPRLF